MLHGVLECAAKLVLHMATKPELVLHGELKCIAFYAVLYVCWIALSTIASRDVQQHLLQDSFREGADKG